MFKVIPLYAIFIIKFLLTKQEEKKIKCGRYEVVNCEKCDYEKENCIKCIDKFFPTYAGLECTPCDDEELGQIGCEGNCDSKTGIIICDKCKEGYYNKEGICLNCSISSPYCAKCSYEAPQGSDKKIFKCLECVNDEYQVSEIDGKCRHCSLPPNCLKCRYVSGTHNVECIKCQNQYYLLNGVCYKCYDNPISIEGGTCYNYYCPGDNDHNKFLYCKCNYEYALTPQNTCMFCIAHCNNCIYDQSTNAAICYNCERGYALTPQKSSCTPCPSNCYTCKYDSQNELKCKSCNNYFVLLNGVCISCGEHCLVCEISNNTVKCTQCQNSYILTDEGICESLSIPEHCNSYQNKRFNNRDEVICTSCKSYYTLDVDNNKCLKCPSYCTTCHRDYNKICIKYK